MTGTTPIASNGFTFMVMPPSHSWRFADPESGWPSATIPASSEVIAFASTPIPFRTWASSRVENLSPWLTTPSL